MPRPCPSLKHHRLPRRRDCRGSGRHHGMQGRCRSPMRIVGPICPSSPGGSAGLAAHIGLAMLCASITRDSRPYAREAQCTSV
eukprot:scaffold14916_cov128-Isochrysis_galbana.AAC.3